MNYLSSVVILIAMAFGLVHCGGDGKSEEATRGPLKLVNNGPNDEDVRFSFDGSTEEGLLIESGKCIEVSAVDLPRLTVWAGSGGIGGDDKILCGSPKANPEEEAAGASLDDNTEEAVAGEAVAKECLGGLYEVDDTAWWVFTDRYELSELDKLDENVTCLKVPS